MSFFTESKKKVNATFAYFPDTREASLRKLAKDEHPKFWTKVEGVSVDATNKVDGNIVSIESNIRQSEEFGDKIQLIIKLEKDGDILVLSGNMNDTVRKIANKIASVDGGKHLELNLWCIKDDKGYPQIRTSVIIDGNRIENYFIDYNEAKEDGTIIVSIDPATDKPTKAYHKSKNPLDPKYFDGKLLSKINSVFANKEKSEEPVSDIE